MFNVVLQFREEKEKSEILFSSFERRKRNLKFLSLVLKRERENKSSYYYRDYKQKSSFKSMKLFKKGRRAGSLLSCSSLIFFNLFSPQNSGQTISENQQARKVQYTFKRSKGARYCTPFDSTQTRYLSLAPPQVVVSKFSGWCQKM